jgi:hypothetical protein
MRTHGITLCTLAVFAATAYAQETFYDQAVPLSSLSKEQQREYLRSIEDPEAKSDDRRSSPWAHTEHQIGYIEPRVAGAISGTIRSAQSTSPDDYESVKKVSVRLDRLKVFDYPGWGGRKNVQLTFEAQNNLKDGAGEDVAFTHVYAVQEGQGAGVLGLPVFADLNLPKSGLQLKIVSINLKTDKQISASGIMESNAFQQGLSLLETAQPAVVPFTALALGLAKMAINTGDGTVIHKFELNLDFDAGATTGARLNPTTLRKLKKTYVAIR